MALAVMLVVAPPFPIVAAPPLLVASPLPVLVGLQPLLAPAVGGPPAVLSLLSALPLLGVFSPLFVALARPLDAVVLLSTLPIGSPSTLLLGGLRSLLLELFRPVLVTPLPVRPLSASLSVPLLPLLLSIPLSTLSPAVLLVSALPVPALLRLSLAEPSRLSLAEVLVPTARLTLLGLVLPVLLGLVLSTLPGLLTLTRLLTLLAALLVAVGLLSSPGLAFLSASLGTLLLSLSPPILSRPVLLATLLPVVHAAGPASPVVRADGLVAPVLSVGLVVDAALVPVGIVGRWMSVHGVSRGPESVDRRR